MRLAFWISLTILVTSSGCGTQRDLVDGSELTSEQKQAIEDSVRCFVLDVAHDVSQDGPTAWRKHFVGSMRGRSAMVVPYRDSNTKATDSGVDKVTGRVRPAQYTLAAK